MADIQAIIFNLIILALLFQMESHFHKLFIKTFFYSLILVSKEYLNILLKYFNINLLNEELNLRFNEDWTNHSLSLVVIIIQTKGNYLYF